MYKKIGPGQGILSVGELGKSRVRIHAQTNLNVRFGDVAGVDEAKAELQEVVEFLATPRKFQHLGGRLPKGVLLVGPPGTGKTLLAKAVAGEAGVPFFSVSGSEFVKMFVGMGAARVRDLFAQAQEKAPCPDIRGREAILRLHAKTVTLAPDVDLRVLAGRTAGFVGADLANLINEAALLAARKSKSQVEMVDFEEAVDRVVAGLEKKARVMTPKERGRVAYHEAGHAPVAESVPIADPAHKISIIPRGIAALGYWWNMRRWPPGAGRTRSACPWCPCLARACGRYSK